MFASEAKAFLAEPGFSREVDLQAVSHYLSLQYIPAPLSAFKGVTKLPPAHTLTVEDGRVSVQRYWRLSYVPQIDVSDDDAPEIEEIFVTAEPQDETPITLVAPRRRHAACSKASS